MSPLRALLVLLSITATTVSAQSVNGALDAPTERLRIQSERASAERRFGQEEAACYSRFAVTDCVREVRARRRTLLDDLRRQELVMNDAERKVRALDQIQRLEEKAAPQKLDQ
jgi:colicin import membrane protein